MPKNFSDLSKLIAFMSLLIEKIPQTEKFICHENFLIIRNDLGEILFENVEEIQGTQIRNDSEFKEHKKDCKLAINENQEELTQKFCKYENLAGHSTFLAPSNELRMITGLGGLISFLLKKFAKEGSSIQEKIFEAASYDNEDSASEEKLMYRSFWNSSVNEASFQRALITLSFLLEVSEKHYEASLLIIRKMIELEDPSNIEIIRIYIENLN